MNWYKGNIAEAVSLSKTKNAIFVVFVEGKDASTEKLTKFINEEKIRVKLESENFVAIKIESETQAYMQFASIYKMVPIPSIFFIGKSGAPLEIGTGVIESAEELDQKIDKVLSASGKTTPLVSASTSFIDEEKKQERENSQVQGPSTSVAAANVALVTAKSKEEETEVVCEGDVCYRKAKAASEKDGEAKEALKITTTEDIVKKEVSDSEKEKERQAMKEKERSLEVEKEKERSLEAEKEGRLQENRKLLEQKRRERIEQENQLEKERELRRRREGKEMQNLQQWQKEHELKELKENIRRERLAEQEARERVLAQIAADRAERANKAPVVIEKNAGSNVADKNDGPSERPQPNNGENARLQFRLSNGTAKTNTFNCQDTLSTVRAYVKTDLLPGTGIRDFILATTYPKREFSTEHDSQTLVALGLYPSAVILVIGKESSNPAAIIARSGGIINMLSTIFWAVLSPVFSIFGYVKNVVTGKRNGDANANANGNTGAQKRANEERGAQHEAAKRRNMDRFSSGPSTSKQATDKGDQFGDTGDEQPKPYLRYGNSNVHRLTDNRKDSDDENATWNGNSTQQQ